MFWLLVATPLLQRRLIFVTGKGGVGKSTIASAIGLVAAARGARTVIADLNSGPDEGERRVTENLYRLSIDPQRAMEEYLTVKVGGPAGQLLSNSRLFSAFAMATPGMRELLSLGKVWELAQTRRRTPDAEPYDLTIVDAPASGHGAALLRTPKTFAEIARVGPIARQADTIAQTLLDRSFTAIVAVAIPEELAVAETLELHEALQRERLELDAVILNACHPDRYTNDEVAALGLLAPAPPLRVALAADARAKAERAQAQRLERTFGGRLQRLPYVFEPELDTASLLRLAEELVL
jgi:anion-transporting  ArsA/GET3 family ATPase